MLTFTKKLHRLHRFILASMLLLSPMLVHATSQWVGKYEYGGIIGTEMNTAMFSDVTLEIDENDKCWIEHNGFQTQQSLECIAKRSLDSVQILFVRMRTGNFPDQYAENGILLSMRRTAGTGELTTTWGLLKPGAAESQPDEGSYFKRSSEPR